MTASAQPLDPDGAPFPSSERDALLRRRLADYLRDGRGPAAEAAVCEVLDALAAEARGRALHGEHALLALKAAWHDLPEVETIGRAERQAALARLVALCLAAYYGGPAAGGPS